MNRAWAPELDVDDADVRLRRTRLAVETLIGRIRPATYFYPSLLTGYLLLCCRSPTDYLATAVAIVIQLGLASVRATLYARPADTRAANPDAWRWNLAVLATAVMFAWDAFVVFELWRRSLDGNSMLLVAVSLVMRASGTYAGAPDLASCRMWSRWSRLPLLLVPVALPTGESVILMSAFLGHFLYSERQYRQLNSEFWRHVIANEETEAAHLNLRHEVVMRERAEVGLRLAQKLESVGRLAAGIAHEINTPLQAILANLAFIGDGVASLLEASRAARASLDAHQAEELDYLTENLPDAVKVATDCVERAATIVRSVNAFAHPGSATKGPVDINKALASTLTISRHEWKDVAEVVTDYGELPLVEGYAGELNQVFLNIIVNAAQAMSLARRDTESRGTLGITTRCDGSFVTIAISDTGCGIPAAIKDRVFDPFFTTKDVGKGTGQGLALAHTVVSHRHGGELTFDSDVGRGTTLTIRLPVEAARAREAA